MRIRRGLILNPRFYFVKKECKVSLTQNVKRAILLTRASRPVFDRDRYGTGMTQQKGRAW